MLDEASNTLDHPARPARTPLLYLAINVLSVTAGQLLLKRSADAAAHVALPAWLSWLGVAALASAWMWAAILCHLVGFVAWVRVLRSIPLSLAFPAASVVQVFVPLGAWALLGEWIPAARWCGIVLILTGIWFIAKPLMVAEEVL